MIGGVVKHATGGQPIFRLLGMIHGHFDGKPGLPDVADADGLTVAQVNVGIAIVVPFRRIAEAVEASKRVLGLG